MDFAAGLVLGCLLGVVATTGTLLLIAATAGERARKTKGLSPSGLALAISAILLVTIISCLANLRAGGLVLLLLSIILAVSRLRGLYTGLAASMFAALALSVVFPPAWSLEVTRPADQLLLALFILGGALGSHMASGSERPAENAAADTSTPASNRSAHLAVSEPYSGKRES